MGIGIKSAIASLGCSLASMVAGMWRRRAPWLRPPRTASTCRILPTRRRAPWFPIPAWLRRAASFELLQRTKPSLPVLSASSLSWVVAAADCILNSRREPMPCYQRNKHPEIRDAPKPAPQESEIMDQATYLQLHHLHHRQHEADRWLQPFDCKYVHHIRRLRFGQQKRCMCAVNNQLAIAISDSGGGMHSLKSCSFPTWAVTPCIGSKYNSFTTRAAKATCKD